MTVATTQVADLISGQLDHVPAAEISAGTRLEEDLRLNSAQVVNLLSELEERFDCVIEDDDLGVVRTVGDLAAIVERAGLR